MINKYQTIIILLALVFVYLYFFNLNTNNSVKDNKYASSDTIDKPNVNVTDLSKPLIPQLYDDIKCRLSTKFYVSVTICVHDLDKDKCEYINLAVLLYEFNFFQFKM